MVDTPVVPAPSTITNRETWKVLWASSRNTSKTDKVLILTPVPLAAPLDGQLAVFEPIIMDLLISSIRWNNYLWGPHRALNEPCLKGAYSLMRK